MKTFWTPLLIAALSASAASAGDDHRYAADRIPPGLRVSASAVVLEDTFRYEIFSRSSAEEDVTLAYTIFTPEGRHFGIQTVGYDKFRTIKDFEGTVYDEKGEEVATMRSADIRDESRISWFSIYEDAREKIGTLMHDRFPYTVVFHIRIAYSGYTVSPDWIAQVSDEPVVHTRCEYVVPEGIELRVKTNNGMAPTITKKEHGRNILVWELSNLPEKTPDEMQEDLEKRTTIVWTSPSVFELGGHEGSNGSWQALGLWASQLYVDKDQLPDKAKAEVDTIVKGVTDQREIVARLYRYMQKRTRYVSVQLGIGGWEPFDAAYVYERGYGDCKALSNFIVALLKQAHITAYPVLIWGGGDHSGTTEDFPSNSFNHVIACVPLARDSIWLECTDQDQQAGVLGAFTENRLGLLLTPEGGILVHTPATRACDNRFSCIVRVSLFGMGDATASAYITRTGNLAKSSRELFIHQTKEQKEQAIINELDVSHAKLVRYAVDGIEEPTTFIHETARYDITGMAAASGGRLFLQPNLTNRNITPPREVKKRLSPKRFGYPYVVSDSAMFALPPHSRCEAVPSPVALKTSFGAYESSTKVLGDTSLFYTRRFEISVPEIPADHYQEYVTFMKAVVKADKAQVVINRN